MRPMTTLTTICLLLTFWSVVMTVILLSNNGPEQDERARRYLVDMEVRIDAFDTRNRQHLDELHQEIKQLKAVLLNHTNQNQIKTNQHPPVQVDIKSIDRDVEESDKDLNKESTIGVAALHHESSSIIPAPAVVINSTFNNDEPIAILLIACNREIVSRAIDSLLKYRPSEDLFPIIVSQDCIHEGTSNVIDSYGDKISHIKQPDQSEFPLKGKERKMKGYYKIARHYKWALGQVFDVYGYNYAIVVEDDLEVAPDFYSYFQATRPLLATDKKLWCVSAWNDNGKEVFIDTDDIGKLYRTDFFPGLGWMLTVNLWHELKDKWPISYWDDWMRLEEQRNGRSCIRPEISRTRTFGKKGVSHGQYFEQHLKYIVLNEKPYDFLSADLSYLLEGNYEEVYVKRIHSLKEVSLSEVIHSKSKEEVQVRYSNLKEFKAFAKHLKIMSDSRAYIPRTAYKGIVSFRRTKRQIHLTPPITWTKYEV